MPYIEWEHLEPHNLTDINNIPSKCDVKIEDMTFADQQALKISATRKLQEIGGKHFQIQI